MEIRAPERLVATAVTAMGGTEMEEYYFDAPLSKSRSLCVGPITRNEAASADAPFCDGLGYYLYLADTDNPSGAEVLARFASEDAARRMSDMLRRFAT
jgi:hypothetical protein